MWISRLATHIADCILEEESSEGELKRGREDLQASPSPHAGPASVPVAGRDTDPDGR
jgi:hypothetical protein